MLCCVFSARIVQQRVQKQTAENVLHRWKALLASHRQAEEKNRLLMLARRKERVFKFWRRATKVHAARISLALATLQKPIDSVLLQYYFSVWKTWRVEERQRKQREERVAALKQKALRLLQEAKAQT